MIKGGFVPVVLFAGLLGLATVLHWDVFSHQHVTFWIWATLYFTTPFLVFGAWLANRRTAAVPAAEELRLSRPARWVVVVIGFLALVQGLVMFLAPGLIAPFWPWSVTALSCRVIGAMFCLGVAGLVVLTDPRWRTIKLLFQVEMIMVTLMLFAAFRAVPEFDPHNGLTWLLGGGFVAILAGSIYLWVVMTARARRTSAPDQRLSRKMPGGSNTEVERYSGILLSGSDTMCSDGVSQFPHPAAWTGCSRAAGWVLIESKFQACEATHRVFAGRRG